MFLVMRLSGLSVMLVPSRFWGCSMFSTSRFRVGVMLSGWFGVCQGVGVTV